MPIPLVPVIAGAVAIELGKMLLEDLMNPKPLNEGEDAFLKGLKQNQGQRIKELPPPAPIRNPDPIQVYDNSTVSYNTQNIFVQNNFYFTPVLAPQIQNPVNIPPRRLPKEADGQTAFNTPNGTSISVKEALAERKFGSLLHRPLNNKKYKFRIAKYDKLATEFKEKNERGKERLAYWIAAQTAKGYEVKEEQLDDDGQRISWNMEGVDPDLDKPLSLWDATAVIGANSLKGFRGDIGLIFGLEALHTIAKDFSLSRINAYQEISGLIPLDYEIVEYEPEIENKYKETEVNFSASYLALIPKIYDVLGGNIWESETFEKGEVLIEGWLRSAGLEQYTEESENNKISPQNLPDLIRHYLATLYFRSGFHRLPAEVPETLLSEDPKSKKKDEVITISDALHFQEWTIEQLDALMGQFPIQFKYKDVEGKEQQLKLNNLAETLAELVGLSINIATDSDTSVALGIKTLTEAVKASNSSIVAADYAKANADYLGYKGEQFVRDVPVSFTPNKESLRELLKDSTLKLASWKYEGQDDLQEQIGKLLIVSQIVKAALFQPFKPDGKLTGDDIKKQKEKDKEEADKQWQEFVTRLNNPAGIFQTDNPKPEIKDLNIKPNP